ncbi:sporulation membrane protein YtaF [Salipaludibacillus aurantiacus]|uniref:Putative sporulation protein YtaF n=1 Tax=Salipaludibacillus aurantiacus TaxID=1601833 RepID=A0A1H9SYC1_9BACI|nr:sporulation membrane protein YtaF [Salipaludibacillus aurantiacus]SER89827.1 putative sporulation protein YtaF [Salipaludibacillus aurantiacus]
MTGSLSLFLLAFAVSLDSFGVGVTYGLRKMRMPFISILLIMLCSGGAVLLAMWIGGGIASFLSPGYAETLGGALLILIGLYALYQAFKQSPKKPRIKEEMLMNFELKRLGIVINVLKKPMEADLDDSGSITGPEAFLLGAALSLDAFGAGMGAALLGVSPWFLAISVALSCGMFLTLGKISGERLSQSEKLNRLSFLPGILLIVIGLWQI